MNADIVILPAPFSVDGKTLNCPGGTLPGTLSGGTFSGTLPLLELLNGFRPEQFIFAGKISPEHQREMELRRLRSADYLRRETYAIANAALTADAAVLLTRQYTTGVPLNGKRALVIGFGRIGKLLCNRLETAGVSVTVSARRVEDMAWIRAFNWTAVPTGKWSHIPELSMTTDGLPEPSMKTEDVPELSGKTFGLDTFDLIYNTVPALLLHQDALANVRKDTLLMDLASRPGMDFDAVRKLGLRGTWERALPGRIFPMDAARILRDTIYDILRENA